MIQTRTSVRFLKYLGIGLIALPEPVTTAFGVALLFTALHLSQKLKLNVDTLREEYLLPWQFETSRSLETNSPLGWQIRYDTKVNVVYHTMDLPRLYRRYWVRSDGSKVKPRDFRPEPASDNDQKLVRHTIDLPRLYRRYGMAPAH
jgi:hypothetical protein